MIMYAKQQIYYNYCYTFVKYQTGFDYLEYEYHSVLQPRLIELRKPVS